MHMTMTSSTGPMSTAMSTAVSMTMSSTSTKSGMSMGAPTGSSMNSSMPMSSGHMMSMQSMAMAFFTSPDTPLFSIAWTPNTLGQYAGTCIFLIALAAIFRALLALRVEFQTLLAAADTRRDYGLTFDPNPGTKSFERQWRAREAVLLGFLDVALAAVGYLLMIAVMTMNVGYFFSVLGGVFIGSVGFGRFTAASAAH